MQTGGPCQAVRTGIVRGIQRACSLSSAVHICSWFARGSFGCPGPILRDGGAFYEFTRRAYCAACRRLGVAVQDWTGRQPRETEGAPASPRSRAVLPGKGSPRPHSTRITESLGRGSPQLQKSTGDERNMTPHLACLAENLCTLSYGPLKWDTRPRQ